MRKKLQLDHLIQREALTPRAGACKIIWSVCNDLLGVEIKILSNRKIRKLFEILTRKETEGPRLALF